MKLPRVQIREVDPLGRNDLDAVKASAAAAAGETRAMQNVVGLVSDIATDYIVRKQDAEYNDAKTEYSTTYSAWQQKYEAKEFYSADDLGDIPENVIPRYEVTVGEDGKEVKTKRTSIPAYEVYPHLQKQMLEGMNNTIADKISHPDMRNEFIANAQVFAANQELRSGVQAEQEQQVYGRKVAVDQAEQLAISGDLAAARFTIDNGEFNEQQKLELTRKVNEIYEWEQDTRVLNTLDLPTMKARLAQLTSEDYGSVEGDHLGPGKASGPYNQAADIARFKSAITTLESTKTNTNSQRVEEHIKAISLGGFGENNMFYNEDGSVNHTLIGRMGFSESKTAKLQEDLRMATVRGVATQAFLGTNIDEDKALLDQAYKQVTESATDRPDFTNESLEYYEAATEAYTRKMERLTTDGMAYVTENNPAVQASLAKLEQMPEGATPEMQAAYMQEHLAIVRAEQQRLGLTPQEVNFLAPTQVTGVKQQLAEASRSPNGASDAVGMLQQMEQQYGQEFPAVYSQLLREGALQDEHIAMMFYPDPSSRMTLAATINNKDEIYADQTVKNNLTDIKNDVAVAMVPIMASLVPAGTIPTNEQGATVRQQVRAIVDAAVLQTSSMVSSTGRYDASMVDQYTTDLFDSMYTFHGEMRVPKNAGYDESRISRGVDQIRVGRGYEIPPGTEFAGMTPAGLTPEDHQILLREEFSRGIRVVTNNDETGVNYLWSNGNPVQIMDGNRSIPLTSSFSDIESMGNAVGGPMGAGRSDQGNKLRLGVPE